MDGYTSQEVCDAADVSYRQLDYWARSDLLRPSLADARGSGSRRRWSAHDIAVAVVLGRVGGMMPVNRLGQLAGFLEDLPLTQWMATTLILGADGEVWLNDGVGPKVGIHVDLSLVFEPDAVRL